jgi:tRNA threonylcarbamoyladenosine biosynthesis protein TsaE
MGRERIVLTSPEETVRFGAQFAARLFPNAILALQGDLGAGKTTFVQGLLDGFNIRDRAQSPTFTYLHVYAHPIYHFDLYRLKSQTDFHNLGFDEFLTAGGISVIEWPDRIGSLLPPDAFLIRLSHHNGNRIAEITTWGNRGV